MRRRSISQGESADRTCSPALTFTNCLLRKLPWRRFPIYLLAQFLGGFVAAGVIYANYINGINTFEGGPGLRTVPPSQTATAGIFCTYPQPDLTKASQFFSEFIASAILMFVIFALKDDTNKGAFKASGNWFPLALFFLIFGLGACFGWNTGYVSSFCAKPVAAMTVKKEFPTKVVLTINAGNQLGPRLRTSPLFLLRWLRPRSLECRRLLLLDSHGGAFPWLRLRWFNV